jgi:hypothetical protein
MRFVDGKAIDAFRGECRCLYADFAQHTRMGAGRLAAAGKFCRNPSVKSGVFARVV